jgi:glycosyltransferase involved in cell wall biosynthesis
VLPSVYEGFGLPILEALLAGTLVITTKSASLSEVGGDKVIYFDTGSAESLSQKIKEAFQLEPKVRLDMIENGKQWAAGFSWKKSAAQTSAILSFRNKLKEDDSCLVCNEIIGK